MELKRYEGNPIVWPGKYHWRAVASFNPGVVLDDDGTFYMLERATSNLAPLYCQFGLLKSGDGLHFEHVVDEPVFTAAQLGTPQGTVEDARVVKIDGVFYMTYVHRNYAPYCYPTGRGIPDYHSAGHMPPDDPNNYRSGIARSTDMIHWEDLGRVTPVDVDDRDCVLFPDKVRGRYAMLRRPMHYVGPQYGCEHPSIWLSYSDDLKTWDDPVLVASAENPQWEGTKIGAAAQPMKTDQGWLALYHGVDRKIIYRTGVMLLDLDDPSKVIARSPEFILEPREYYEKVGLIIPNVVFPSANVVKDGVVYVYYGCTDTCIAVATVGVDELLAYVLKWKR